MTTKPSLKLVAGAGTSFSRAATREGSNADPFVVACLLNELQGRDTGAYSGSTGVTAA